MLFSYFSFVFEVASHVVVVCAPEVWGVLSFLRADLVGLNTFNCFNLFPYSLVCLVLLCLLQSLSVYCVPMTKRLWHGVADFYIQTISMNLGRINAGAANCEITITKDSFCKRIQQIMLKHLPLRGLSHLSFPSGVTFQITL